MKKFLIALVPLIALPVISGWTAPEFERDVKPIFEQNCYGCHGADRQRGELRLDYRDGAFAGSAIGPIIVPGDSESSILIHNIEHREGANNMPAKGDPLSAEQIALIRAWIDAGAVWPADEKPAPTEERSTWRSPHWSLQPLTQPPAPEPKRRDWVRNPIDAFVARMHETQGLEPASETDRRTLIRRLSYDLHGLPPTPEAIQQFLDDDRTDAYERLVDGMLASPRYGERWARHWLDVAHYGETHGFDKDQRRNNAWPYRDYVIEAFNSDKPYARFVEEQIAGDALFPGEPDGVVATGFLAAGPWDLVGQAEVRDGTLEKKRVRNLDRDDILTSVFNTFQSTTVQCARCHDHKFDPISISDYYAVQSVFAGIDRSDRDFEEPEFAIFRSELRGKRKALETSLKDTETELSGHLPDSHAALETEIKKWREELATLTDPKKQSSPANGYHSVVRDTPETTEWVQVDLGEAVALDRIVLIPARPTDYKDTPGFGFPIRFDVSAATGETFDETDVVLDSRERDYANPGDSPVAIDMNGRSVRYIRITATHLWERQQDYALALAELEAYADDKQFARGATVTASSSIDYGRWNTKHLVNGYDSRKPLMRDETELTELTVPLEARIAEAQKKQRGIVQTSVPHEIIARRDALKNELADVKKWEASLPKPKRVYTVKSVKPRPVHVLRRGSEASEGERAEPAALNILHELDARLPEATLADERSARAALAKWVTDPKNDLTWRSIVNRIWQFHFGAGIVATPNDFGEAGTPPTHPELLDWLATEFRDNGGSFKHLHRLILTSAIYRQSSRFHKANASIDGQNRFLWRMNRRKLDAESVRDAILAVSGSLDYTMSGPSVELFNYTHDHSPKYDYVAHDDPAKFRRSIYRFIVRSVPDPLFEALDCADPNRSVPKRHETLTATQALALYNNEFVLQQAQHLANRLRSHSEDPKQQIETAYELALGRPASRKEIRQMTKYAKQHGLENAARVLLNLNEFIFVD